MTTLHWLWYSEPHWLSQLLMPFSKAYQAAIQFRHHCYQRGWLQTRYLPVPVVVVGNLVAGGAGKTPVLQAMVEFLKTSGLKPGIVSRGYLGSTIQMPKEVNGNSDPAKVGDEPVMLARRLGVPVVVCKNRYLAARYLLQHFDCDVILSDDGLQHYALGRDIEVLVVDGDRQFGNRMLLPAGPLREPLARLQQVDFILSSKPTAESPKNYEFKINPSQFLTNVKNPSKQIPVQNLQQTLVHAVCGIGYPERFFNTLRELKMNLIPHRFADHYKFRSKDLNFSDERPVVMTEKDAVKCQTFARDFYWYLPISISLQPEFKSRLLEKIKAFYNK